MVEWTNSAKEELKRYLAHVRERLSGSSVDPKEVEDDLLRHINEEAATAGLDIITREDVIRFGDQMGLPAAAFEAEVSVSGEPSAPSASDSGAPDKKKKRRNRIGLGAIFFFGIILPLGTLVLELLTGLCGSTFFDPIPTLWHVLLVAWVPFANLAASLALWRGESHHPRILGWLNGIAIGVALYYTIIFLPLSPIALIGIIWFGLGLIPLSPLFSLICASILRAKLHGLIPVGVKPALWRTVLLVFLCLILIDAPKVVTMAAIQRAALGNPRQRASAVRLLRKFGSDKELLRSCYGVNKPVTDMVSFIFRSFTTRVSASEIQNVYYRVTGTPYNAVKPPDLRGLRRGRLIDADDWDFAQGGDEVAARVRGLTLQQSRIDGRIDATAGTAYTEWTMVFHNTASQQRESRATIALPRGSVVSRVTLWIDGEEREAAYAGRAKVKAAYKRVVQRRRDPVLVTTCGPDRILVQCFPVPPSGGTMKIKIGITSPLVLESLESGLVRLPCFAERNFGLDDAMAHTVWFEGHHPLSAAGVASTLHKESVDGGRYALRGNVGNPALLDAISVRVDRKGEPLEAWTDAERGPAGHIVRQSIVADTVIPPSRLAIVIDGSQRMEEYAGMISAIVDRLVKMTDCEVYVASDDVVHVTASDPKNSRTVARTVRRMSFAGGCDNVPALKQAWDAVSGSTNSAILWLHATQPAELDDIEALLQRFQRRPGNPRLYDYQFGDGPNMIARQLSDIAAFRRVPQILGAEGDLDWCVKLWEGKQPSFRYERQVEATGQGVPAGAHVDLHIARLWVHGRVLELARSRSDSDRAEAVKLATSYLLVTPVSGAVVLETAQQYAEAGLSPVDAHLAPAVVPEPETWSLLLVGALLIGAHTIHQRRRRERQVAHA